MKKLEKTLHLECWQLRYDELIPVLVNGIKEQQLMIHNQKYKNTKTRSISNTIIKQLIMAF